MGLNTGLGGALTIRATLALGTVLSIYWDGSSFFMSGELVTLINKSFSVDSFKF